MNPQLQQEGKISFSELFKLSSRFDKFCIFAGTLSAIMNGGLQPLFGLLFGQMSQEFGPNSTPDQIVSNCTTLAYWFIGIGGISFVLSCLMMTCWINVGERQAIKFRLEYFKSLIKQEIGFFDQIQPNELSSKVALECFHIQSALGEKICVFIYSISMYLGSLIISFLRGWQIALVSSAVTPIIALTGYFYQWVSEGIVKKTQKAYQSAGGVSEQALSSIRTVKSLNGQEFEKKKYSNFIKDAFKMSLKFSIFTGISLGLQNMMFFMDFGITFWVGSRFIENKVYNDNMGRAYEFSDIITSFLAIMMSSFELGQAMNSLKAFTVARQAGYNMFQILERKSKVDLNLNGKEIQNIKGDIQFKDVNFAYPTQPDIKVLSSFTLDIKPNMKTAFVGESGSGKSTIIQLIERFYDPLSGKITIDGHDLKDLKLNSLRSKIGYVGQEPVLFATSIRENLLYGKNDATEQEMIDALKKANAWEFIEKLEKKLDTYVGTSGAQFSGGQKQRISIARAILKNPSILLLDEATSALDRKNESQIQKTLDEVSTGRTTLVVAHRLSTIQNADEIVVIVKGTIVERGTHETLLLNKAAYFEFVEKQKMKEQKEVQKDPIYTQQSTTTDYDNETYPTSNDELANLKLSHHPKKSEAQFLPLNGVIEEEEDDVENKRPRPSFSTEHMEVKSQNSKELIKKPKLESSFARLFAYNKGQTLNYILGFICAIGNGVTYPITGWVLGNIAEVLLNPEDPEFTRKTTLLSLDFIILGIGQLLSCLFQFFFFSRVAETLTFKLRKDLMKKYLKMPISWFDKTENTPGALTQKLSSDCQMVNNMTSTTLGIQVSNISSLVSALAFSFAADWRTTLVGLSLMPFMIFGQIWYMSRLTGFGEKTDKAYRDSTNMMNDTACNIRTVTSFGNLDQILKHFEGILNNNVKQIMKSAVEAGVAIAVSNFTLFAIYGTVFYAGSTFVRDHGLTISNLFIAIQCLMFAAIGIGSNSFFMGDVGASENAAKNIFQVLDSTDETQINKGTSSLTNVKGEIEFKNVTFKYPERDEYILKNLSLYIPPGWKVAFVGPSGAGKSSIIQLIQRFYDSYTGEILLDGINLKEYDLEKYRSYFGVVSQEPTLFTGTIKENIVYNEKNLKDEDIIEVTKKVNAFDFIQDYNQNDKSGMDRQVGLKGNQLSGGQKQRISICRAMLKNPKIMLLDEATSALDSQNEKIVQASLDVAMKDKTSICVAHRISTIKDANRIYVMEQGQIVEQGSYDQLMSIKNHFFKLAQGHN